MAAKTTKFRKLALTPGTYSVVGSDGQRTSVNLDENRLKRVVDNTKRMLAKGVKVPVPFAHSDENGKVPGPVLFNKQGAPIDYETNQLIGWRSDLNAGYVKAIDYGTYKGQDGVVVDIEAFGQAEDNSTPAGKIGKTVQETSLIIRDQFIDSKGEDHGEVIFQVAAVTNPVEFGQQNFALAMSDNQVVMSEPMAKTTAKPSFPPKKAKPFGEDEPIAEGETPEAADSAPVPLRDEQNVEGQQPQPQPIEDLIAVLNEFGFSLPDDTTPENIIDRLRLCVRQKLADQRGSSPDSVQNQSQQTPQPPQGAGVPGSPIAMNDANPALTIMLSQITLQRREQVRARANRLVESGQVTREWVEKNVHPRVEAIVMNDATLTPEALDLYSKTGQFPPTDIENVLAGLESAAPANLTVQMSNNTVRPEGVIPDQPRGDISATPSAWAAGNVNPAELPDGYAADADDVYELAMNG
jgi:hypothetical protein